MKRVFLVRHAKSDWSVDTDDFERPLNERGKRDAPMMADRLAKKKIPIDAFVSSPAKRALRTAKLFAECMEINKDDIILKSELYLAPAGTFFEVLEKMDDKFNAIAVFSHNNGVDLPIHLAAVLTICLPAVFAFRLTAIHGVISNLEERVFF
jgi:phosphohistidine phosphatase